MNTINSYDEKKIKHYLLQTMDAFHQFCEENSLTYFIIGGTFLGAVRHKGLIPWDDDIDVLMPRDDYDRFLLLSNKLKESYNIKNIKSDNKYIYPYAKFENNNFIVEENFYIPFQIGIWIDVFPLDYTFNSLLLRKIHFSIVAFSRNLSIIKVGSFQLSKYSSMTGKVLELLHVLSNIIPKRLLFSLIEKTEKLGCLGKKKIVANLHGNWGIKESAPKELFNEKILYEFEKRKYWGIKNYDCWLSQVYGEYMILPPEHQRIRAHIGQIITKKS